MPQVYLPSHGGYAHYHILTKEDFYRVKAWGLNKEAFEVALVYMCVDKLDGVKFSPHTKMNYYTLMEIMLNIPPDDEGILIVTVLEETARYYAQTGTRRGPNQ